MFYVYFRSWSIRRCRSIPAVLNKCTGSVCSVGKFGRVPKWNRWDWGRSRISWRLWLRVAANKMRLEIWGISYLRGAFKFFNQIVSCDYVEGKRAENTEYQLPRFVSSLTSQRVYITGQGEAGIQIEGTEIFTVIQSFQNEIKVSFHKHLSAKCGKTRGYQYAI